MKENLKYTSKLAGSAALSFLKINIPGQIFIAVFSVASILTIVFQSVGSGSSAAHVGGVAVLINLFLARPIGLSLVILSAFICPILLFTLGNRYLVSKVIHRLITDKGENILFPIIDKVLNKLKTRQPEIFSKSADKVKLKFKIVQEIKESNENKWLKKIILFALKKANMNGVDFNEENVSLSDIFKRIILTTLKNITEPSRNFFWIICGSQILIFLLVLLKWL
jgi:hypothetical protein